MPHESVQSHMIAASGSRQPLSMRCFLPRLHTKTGIETYPGLSTSEPFVLQDANVTDGNLYLKTQHTSNRSLQLGTSSSSRLFRAHLDFPCHPAEKVKYSIVRAGICRAGLSE